MMGSTRQVTVYAYSQPADLRREPSAVITGFLCVPVFGYSQTEGEPLPGTEARRPFSTRRGEDPFEIHGGRGHSSRRRLRARPRPARAPAWADPQ